MKYDTVHGRATKLPPPQVQVDESERSGVGRLISGIATGMSGERQPSVAEMAEMNAQIQHQHRESIERDQQQKVLKIVAQMSHEVAAVYKEVGSDQLPDWCHDLQTTECRLEFTAGTLQEAEAVIRDWLTRLNDICRIASFFQNEKAFQNEACNPENPQGMRKYLEEMFADCNLPEVLVEMELCRRFPDGSSMGSFSLIDTPGDKHFLFRYELMGRYQSRSFC